MFLLNIGWICLGIKGFGYWMKFLDEFV